MPSRESKALIAMSLQLGFSVAVPTALLAYLGHRLDVMYDRSPIFLMVGLALALFLSLTLVWHIVKIAMHRIGNPVPVLRNKRLSDAKK